MYLILENGAVFEGQTFGYPAPAVGELVFNTSLTGYLETLTDPSYYGQMVIQTFPLIGNYGVIPADFESQSVHVKAYIVREWCQEPSNFRSEGDLDAFLLAQKIPGLCGVDTRALTRIVREHGVMNACFSETAELSEEAWAELRGYAVRGSVEATTCREAYTVEPEDPRYHVLLWDFGAKANITRHLLKRGCKVTVIPASTTAEEIFALKPDGLMLSNGPGDPADNRGVIDNLRQVYAAGIPTFGICLGHQLLALANGARTEKLHYGHRGANQPVLACGTQRCFVTSQNHGYAVVTESLPDYAKLSFVNGNDGSCEGVAYSNRPAFSVQFHPEAAAGPLDTGWLFDQFIELIQKGGAADALK